MTRKSLWAAALVLLLPALALAAPAVTVDPGVRAGLSLSPDQFVFGGQLSFQGLAPDWTFDPSLELGFGDDVTVIAVNLDALYHLRLSGSDWRPYVGGGLGLAAVSWDNAHDLHDDSDNEVGLNVVLGFRVPTRSGQHWFTEMRLGVGDLPDLKVVGGFSFGR
jgi:opacity protein-like surface antigen